MYLLWISIVVISIAGIAALCDKYNKGAGLIDRVSLGMVICSTVLVGAYQFMDKTMGYWPYVFLGISVSIRILRIVFKSRKQDRAFQ